MIFQDNDIPKEPAGLKKLSLSVNKALQAKLSRFLSHFVSSVFLIFFNWLLQSHNVAYSRAHLITYEHNAYKVKQTNSKMFTSLGSSDLKTSFKMKLLILFLLQVVVVLCQDKPAPIPNPDEQTWCLIGNVAVPPPYPWPICFKPNEIYACGFGEARCDGLGYCGTPPCHWR